MSRTPSPAELERRLRAYAEEYEAIKTRLHDIGFICTGSLLERRMVCGKSNCRCHTALTQRHGPYYQLTWKERGITVSRRLPPEHATLYQEWIANRQRLDAILADLYRVSAKAARQLLRAATDDPTAPQDPPQPARYRKKR